MTDRGAHFYRCDFQAHTPRDACWSGPRPKTDAERQQFAENFVAACRRKNLHAVAITDHHDLANVEYIRQAARQELGPDGGPLLPEQRLVVFPGIELTLGVPCQALLLFDADFPADRFSVVLDALAIDITDADKEQLPPVVRCDHIDSLVKLYQTLDHRQWLKDRYIVLPNVSDGGHETLMRTGMQSKYKEMPCVGGYLDGSISKVGKGNRAKFDGLDVAWGNKRIAIFQTSDSRSSTFDNLGKHSTWVKWATPTAEALRQACLAQESRISQAAPELPTIYVTRLSVSNSKFLGPVELELNSQFNAVIGGRGTGKSTLLEYLRWALCDQREISANDEIPDHALRQRQLVERTLQPYDSQVDVHFLINGIQHVVRRNAKDGSVALKVAEGSFEPVTPGDIRALLPIHAYSQKQLSSVSVRVDELSRFVIAPIQAQLDSIDSQMTDAASRVRQTYASLQRYRTLETAIARSQLAVESLTQQATNLRTSLEAVSDADREVLSNKSDYDTADELAQEWSRTLEQARAAIGQYEASIADLLNALPSVESREVPSADLLHFIELEVRAVISDLQRDARRAADVLSTRSATNSEYDRASTEWRTAKAAFDERYNAVKAASTAHESKLHELAEIEERQRAARDSLMRQREEFRKLGNPTDRYSQLRAEWLGLSKRRSELLQEQCEAQTALSDGLIRSSLQRGQGLNALSERLRGAVAGSGVRTTKMEGITIGIKESDDPVATWETVLGELEGLADIEADANVRISQTPMLKTFGLNDADLKKIAGKLSPESWLDLSLVPLVDHPVFEYQTKDSEYIDFALASAGQQATALLRILLNQGGPPLIIDQPEDDLDSQVIQDVISRIWKAKSKRQLIFTSHNANLVVNGDAELVVCCDYRAMGDQSGGRVKLEGAIDVPDVKKEITVVMEGGEKAFRLRKDKYGF